MKLAELVSSFLKEDKHISPFSRKQGLNIHCGCIMLPCTWCLVQILILLSSFGLVVLYKWVTEHVSMLKEIFDKQDSIL